MKILILFFLLLLSFSSVKTLYSSDFVFDKQSGKAVPRHAGEVTILKGSVFYQLNNDIKPLKVGSKISQGSLIKTKAKSFVRLVLVDDSVINLGPHSEMLIEKFQFKDKNDRKMILDVVKGQLRGIVKNKAKEGDLQVKSRLAIMGIRGTEFFMNHHNQNNLEITQIGMLEGVVHVSNEKGLAQNLFPNSKLTLLSSPNNDQGSVHELEKITEDELKVYKNDQSFMPILNIESLPPQSRLSQLINKSKSFLKDEGEEIEISDEMDEKSDWRKNLQKLNEKLHQDD